MQILHTADWHLGHRLYERDRTDEHRAFLDWLLLTIRQREVELLIVAGDVFDSMNPSNTARGLYYDFLARLRTTGCHSVVIIGGNHDSPSLLDAPAELMAHFRIHVVGGAKPEVADQLIPIVRPGEGEPCLLVAAVPFLRDRDLKYSVIGETATDRVSRMREAIRQHYVEVGEAVPIAIGTKYPNVPIVATGHLFAAGSEDAEDKQSNIYLADKHNIQAGQFPAVFDYVALGHVHRAQAVGGSDRIRYAGSPVALTFGEAKMKQSVCLLDLTVPGQEVRVERIPVPVSRELVRLRGPVEEVRAALTRLVTRRQVAATHRFGPWVEARVITPHPLPLLREELRELLGSGEVELLGIRTERPEGEKELSAPTEDLRSLSDWDPEEVFHRLCHGGGEGAREDYPELLASFRELRGWMTEKETDR